MNHSRPFFQALTLTALLAGCAGSTAPSGPPVRLFAADMNGGAKTCETGKITPAASKVTEATMKVGSDGGWCGLPVRNGDRPFDAGLMTVRADHGKVFVHRVGHDTRVDYTPNFGFVGADNFTVSLLPGDAGVRISVTVVAR